MIIATKKDGSPRRTVDLQKVNQATLRETHHTPAPFNQVSIIPPYTKKTALDAWNGYHSLPLAPDARDATTFITEWGRYRYLRAPQGFHASGDGYTRRFDDITIDFPDKTRCIDDSLLWKLDIENSFWQAVDYIRLCALNGVVFNPEKFQFALDIIDFAGFTVTSDGYKPNSKMLDSIRNFPTPKSITDIRAWFGLVNQVSYAFSQADAMKPFRELLKSKTNKFYWDDVLQDVFEQSKRKIVEQICEGVRSFEMNRPTCLSTDYCKEGIGFTLKQKHCSCPEEDGPNCGPDHWKLIFVGSRFTKDSESNYAPIEGESLALCYGLKSCRMFVLGCPYLTCAVDHKPLIKIFSDQSLEKIENPRILDFKEKTLMYRFTIRHVPGEQHVAPDTMSRHPSSPDKVTNNFSRVLAQITQTLGNESDLELCVDDSALTKSFSASLSQQEQFKALTWERIANAARSDKECIDLCTFINTGFPQSRNDLPEHIRVYWPIRNELYVLDSIPIKGKKTLIPRSLRAEVLEILHSAHQGVTGMSANARQRLFWPGLDSQLRLTRAQCKPCNDMAPSQPREPLIEPPSAPTFPFQMTVTDFYELKGNQYLVYADRYTGWVETALMRSGTAPKVCNQLRRWFCTYGAPDELSSDGGPPFDSFDYKNFLSTWGVKRRLSSAHFPQSNGRAELAVKSAKRILADNTDNFGNLDYDAVAVAFLTHRNTPVQDVGLSPAQMLFGRPIKDFLPNLLQTTTVSPQWREIREQRELAMAKRHVRHQQHHDTHTKELQPLVLGDTVLIQNQSGPLPKRWHKTGRVVESLGNRQYRIKVDGSNRITLRNRRFLRKLDCVADIPCSERSLPEFELPRSTDLYPANDSQLPFESEPASHPVNRHQEDKNDNECSSNNRDKMPETPKFHSLPPSHQTMPQSYLSPPQLSTKSTTHPSSVEPLMTPNSRTTPPPRSLLPLKKGTTFRTELFPEEPEVAPLRRSSRVSQPRKLLSVQMKGKHHMLIPNDSTTSHIPVPPVEPVDKGEGGV